MFRFSLHAIVAGLATPSYNHHVCALFSDALRSNTKRRNTCSSSPVPWSLSALTHIERYHLPLFTKRGIVIRYYLPILYDRNSLAIIAPIRTTE